MPLPIDGTKASALFQFIQNSGPNASRVGGTGGTTDTTGAGSLGGTGHVPPPKDPLHGGDLQNITVEDLSAAIALLESLSASSLSPDVINSLLGRLMIEQAASQRSSALNDRLLSRQEAKSQLLDQAATMDKAAAEMMTGAIVAIVMTVIGSAISIIGSVASIKSSLGGTQAKIETANKAGAKAGEEALGRGDSIKDAMKEAAEVAKDALKSSLTKLEKFGLAGKAIETVGGSLSSLGNTGKAISDAGAKTQEAQGARDAAEAQDSQADADRFKEIQGALDDMIKAIINFLKELQDAKADQMQSLTKV